MQEIHHHPMIRGDGGSERFYSGGIGSGDGGDRRMRAQQSHHNIHQALKCPRCNSLNTKFCYYNNYNLSQPRHFCKNCRRYWTKGGVLRNVPIGGGCRKAKRSKPNISSSSAAAGGSTVKPPPDAVDIEREGEGMSRASHSSSDSSSLSAVAVTHIRPGSASAAEVASVSISDFSMNSTRLYGSGIEWSAMDGGIFSELGRYTDLISTAPANETAPFGFGGNTVNLNQQCLDHLKVDGETVNQKSEDRTAEVEFVGRSSDPSDGFEPLDWGGAGVDQVLFDLTSTVDHEYWSQSQWTTDQDHNGFYLP